MSVFALTRLIDFVMISLSARTQVVLTHTLPGYYVYTPTPTSPGYLDAITNWDGQWYQRIVAQGYAVTAVGRFKIQNVRTRAHGHRRGLSLSSRDISWGTPLI